MSNEQKKYSKVERKWLDDCVKQELAGMSSNPENIFTIDNLFSDAETMLAESIKRYGPLEPDIDSVQPSAGEWLPVSELVEAEDGMMWVVLSDDFVLCNPNFHKNKITMVKWDFLASTFYKTDVYFTAIHFPPSCITHFMPIKKPELPK
jgi:hypothetical protein